MRRDMNLTLQSLTPITEETGPLMLSGNPGAVRKGV